MVFTITRDSKTGMVLPMAIGFHDPVIIAALNAIGTQDCRTARLIVDADAERAALLAQVFRVNRGFAVMMHMRRWGHCWGMRLMTTSMWCAAVAVC